MLNSSQPTTPAGLAQNVRCEGLSNPSLGCEVHTDEGFHWTYPISLSSVGLSTMAVLWRVLHCWARSLLILNPQMWHGPFDNHLEILGLCLRPTILPQGLCLRPTTPASSCSGPLSEACHMCIIQCRDSEGLPSMHHPVEGLCLGPTTNVSSSGRPLFEAYHPCAIQWRALRAYHPCIIQWSAFV